MDKKQMDERLDELLFEYNERFGPWPKNARMKPEEMIATLETCLRNNRPYRDANGEDPGLLM